MSLINKFVSFLPEVKGPEQKKLSFKEKLKWTLIVLIAFFILGVIPLYGLESNALSQFRELSIILGASFGSILSLGIGPIVTGSIVLQLLVGSGILKIDTTTHDGRTFFQSLQKLTTWFFIIFEAIVYVMLNGLIAQPGMEYILITQLIIGGILIFYMDEVTNKWGFGSGVSLFIASGVAAEIFIRAFSPLTSSGTFAFGVGSDGAPIGAFFVFILSLINGSTSEAFTAAFAIIATIIVFVISVYGQAMKVEIPLSFGRVRGYGVRWPLNFLYTSNIPVILIAALLANIQLAVTFLQTREIVSSATATSIASWVSGSPIVLNAISGSLVASDVLKAIVYMVVLALGSVVFSIFWVQSAGMNAQSQAKQIRAAGLHVAGFRTDQRILERILERYIFPLTVMGGLSIGLIAAGADLLGALSRGTGILLAVMIIYKLYEDIAKQHMMDMHPSLRKMMGGDS